MYEKYLKRPFDILASGLSLLLGTPILILIGAAIRIDTPGPVLYRQQRIGRGGKPFQILKFRSMLPLEHSKTSNGEVMPNEDRVTRAGRVLRSSGLDELPQLINVMRGEMSLVGPRPTLPYQVERYTDFQNQRLNVRPGLTGLAQVMGRNDLTWDQKIAFDVEYARNITAIGDLMIILRTFRVILGGRGVKFKNPDALSKHNSDYWKDI
jgi:lipopolysaccharide/colanic/teichoic acid biosynthesis glycosyltransferase